MGVFYRVAGFLEMLGVAVSGVGAIVNIAQKGVLYSVFPVWLWIVLLIIYFVVGAALGLLLITSSKPYFDEMKKKDEPNYYTGEKLNGIQIGDKVILNYAYGDYVAGTEATVVALRSISAAIKIGDDTIEVKKAHLRKK